MKILGLNLGSNNGQPPPIPTQAPNYPEHGGMYAAWEAEDMTGVAGIALDNSSLIIQIRAFLSGQELIEEKDEQTGRKRSVWRQVADPKMNDKGVRSLLLELRALLDKNTIMTYWPSHDDIKDFMQNFSVELVFFLAQNMEDFDIKVGHESQVADFIINNVYITCLRGLMGNEKKGIYKEAKRIENVHTYQGYGQQQGKQLFG